MTVYWYKDNGQILQTAAALPPASPLDDMPGVTRAVTDGPVGPMTHYVDSRRLVAIPERPTPHHDFDWDAKVWVLDVGRAWLDVRRERDARLTACDWVVTRAQEAGEAVPEPWREYRQALRDITEQADPCAIEWPVPPES